MSKFFRNIEAIGDIDPGSLWINEGNGFTLVDEDDFRQMGDEWQHIFLSVPDPNAMGCPPTDHPTK